MNRPLKVTGLCATKLPIIAAVFAVVLLLIALSPSALAARPLGLFELNPADQDGDTITGFEKAKAFKIRNIPNTSRVGEGYFAKKERTSGTPEKGLVVGFNGGDGMGWYLTIDTNPNPTPQNPLSWKESNGNDLVQTLCDNGFMVINVSWKRYSTGGGDGTAADFAWLFADQDATTGIANLACQPATVIKYLHDTYYKPMLDRGLNPALGQAGFCLVGTSGGASQIAYALSHYGMANRADMKIDLAIMTGGPIHTDLVKSCIDDVFLWEMKETKPAAIRTDKSWGFYYPGDIGPANSTNGAFVESYRDTFARESIVDTATVGNNYNHPSTRVVYIIGADDGSIAEQTFYEHYIELEGNQSNLVTAYGNAPAGSPACENPPLPNVGHLIALFPNGVDAIRDAILSSGSGGNPPPAPTGLTVSTVSSSQLNLSWTASAGATSYNVKRSTTSGGPYTVIAPGVTSTSYNNTGLAASTTYYYVVSAVNTSGESPNSAQASGTTSGGTNTTVTFYSVATHDGYLLESGETTNAGGSAVSTGTTTAALRAGDNNLDRQYKSVVSFDTTSLPDGATIVSATLKLKRGEVTGTNPFTTHGTCRVDIKNGTGFGNALTLAPGDFEVAASAVQVATLSNALNDGDWSTGGLNATGLSFINKTGHTQLRVYFTTDDNDDSSNDYIGWYSGDNGTPANHPIFEIVYN